VVLMDDPVSALDADVRKKVFEQVFQGLLKGKTRILVTHSIDFLHLADKVVILRKGQVKAQGTVEQLKEDPYMQEVLAIHSSQIASYKRESQSAAGPFEPQSKEIKSQDE
jgi:ABC-type proline/glycine betaine transport system ATPase subunit